MPQTITPELRRWIIEQATAGFGPDSVLRAMREAGWAEDTALSALEETLSGHLAALRGVAPVAMRQAPAGPAWLHVEPTPAETLDRAERLPMPALDGAPRGIDCGDRVVDVLVHLRTPPLVVFGNLLSDLECEALMDSARPRMARSLTVQTETGGEELNEDRTSHGMFFRRGETELVARIEARIARLLNWPVDHGEGLQVLYYQPGAEYKPHYDYFDPQAPGTPHIVRRGGQRLATLVMYLNEPQAGGGTVFPDLGLEVTPKRGHAVYFAYDRPLPSTRTLHGGLPVISGEKWVATKWLREGEFT